MKEKKTTVQLYVCAWEYERFQTRKTKDDHVIKENSCSRFKIEFLIHCRKKQYLKYLFQAAEEILSHYIKKQQKQKEQTKKPTKNPFLFMTK